jgi:putative chitinase
MLLNELFSEADLPSRRGFLKGLGAAGLAGALGYKASKLDDEPAVAASTPAPVAADPEQDEISRFIKDQPTQEPAQADVQKQYGPSTSRYANAEAQSQLARYARSQGIVGVELAALLAQSATETLSFSSLVERGGKDYFRQYDGKMGNDRPGDGYRYRGRGYLHITGKEMYARCGKALKIDLVKHPELLEQPKYALLASIWYWNDRVKPFVRDWNDVAAVTRRVNGGLAALDDRAANFADYRKKLGV